MSIGDELKMGKFESPYHKAALNIIYTGYWLTSNTDSFLKPYGLSAQQFNVLRILRGQKGKDMNLYEIQDRMLSRMSNATRLVEKLRLKNLVTRKECPGNRRKVEIGITAEGLDLLKKLDEELRKTQKANFKNISPEEAETLSNLLDKIRES